MKRLVVLGLVACGSSAPTEPLKTTPTSTSPSPSPNMAAPPMTTAKLVIPDTPAGKTLQAWLVFNSGDESKLQAFATEHKAPEASDPEFRKQTGGFELLSIDKSEPLAIRFVVKEKAGPTQAVGWLKIKEDGVIERIDFQAIPPGVTAADMDPAVDAATRTRVVDAAVAKLNEFYVFPDIAKKMEQALRAHQQAGDYDKLVEARVFVGRLTDDLRAVSHDKHLRVDFSPSVLPVGDPEPTEDEKAKFREQMERMNCGFRKAEKLDGNIGYVKFDFFGDAEVCGPKATAAFAAIAGVDAVIFDLRENGGGQPAMVAFVCSYLFAKKTHLNDIYERKGDKTEQFWTKPDVPGDKLAKQPVFVLTSQRTFSGAEEFTYNLKNLKRATIVGETTGGGAHPTRSVRLDDHFMLFVPFARAINPITKTNWEGTGVDPHVKVAADQALETAKKLASDAVAKQKKPRTR